MRTYLRCVKYRELTSYTACKAHLYNKAELKVKLEQRQRFKCREERYTAYFYLSALLVKHILDILYKTCGIVLLITAKHLCDFARDIPVAVCAYRADKNFKFNIRLRIDISRIVEFKLRQLKPLEFK